MALPARQGPKEWKDFTDKEAALVEAYTDPNSPTYRNKLYSYKAAGYYFAEPPEGEEDDGRGRRAAKSQAAKIFRKDHIEREITERFRQEAEYLKLPMEELLVKLSNIADANLVEYLHPVPSHCPHCEGELPFTIDYQFDIEQMKKDGVGALLKKMRPTKFGSEFDFHDASEALDKMMKHYGGYSKATQTDISAFDEVITLARKRERD